LKALAAILSFAAFAALACGDPAHDQAVAALGGEKGSPGPTHRPGQPCGICHGGSGPGNEQFAVGGTVYAIKGQGDPLVNAVVYISDANGDQKSATTNSAGNFYIPSSRWAPKYPLSNIVVVCGPLTSQSPYTCGGSNGPTDTNAISASMHTSIGREGSCAGCHFGTPNTSTRGPVYVGSDPSAFGGTPTP
jgi:hypothetical protein